MGGSSGPVSIPAQLHVAEGSVQAQSQSFVPQRLISERAIFEQLDQYDDRLSNVLDELQQHRSELKANSSDLESMAEECADLHSKVDALVHLIARGRGRTGET